MLRRYRSFFNRSFLSSVNGAVLLDRNGERWKSKCWVTAAPTAPWIV